VGDEEGRGSVSREGGGVQEVRVRWRVWWLWRGGGANEDSIL